MIEVKKSNQNEFRPLIDIRNERIDFPHNLISFRNISQNNVFAITPSIEVLKN